MMGIAIRKESRQGVSEVNDAVNVLEFFQANILLGTIVSVEKGALDSEALVRPSVNFADLGTVFVVLSAKP